MNQVAHLQEINTRCVGLLKELSQYKSKSETLQQINNKLRAENTSLKVSKQVRPKEEKEEEVCDDEDNTHQLETELEQIRKQLLGDETNNNSEINALKTQINNLKYLLDQKENDISTQKDRLANIMTSITEDDQVKRLTYDLGAKTDCFWNIIEELKPYVRQTMAKPTFQMNRDEYIQFIQAKIVSKIDSTRDDTENLSCNDHFQQYLQELEEATQ